jgi:hypothetical protein
VFSSSAASLVPDSIFRLLSLRLREAEPEAEASPLVCACAKADPAQIAASTIVNISFLIKIPLSFLIKRRVKSHRRERLFADDSIVDATDYRDCCRKPSEALIAI